MRVLAILVGLMILPAQAHSISPYDEIADRLSQQLVQQLNDHPARHEHAQLGITRWVMSDTLSKATPKASAFQLFAIFADTDLDAHSTNHHPSCILVSLKQAQCWNLVCSLQLNP